MNEPAPAAAPEFLAEVERVRASGVLGRASQLQRLFEFLVACQASGRVPKELEVAVDCFERGPQFDVAQDATVRVTAHKLRKRLEEFYRNGAGPGGVRLEVPRGEYRLALTQEPVAPAAEPPRGLAAWLPASRRERVLAALVVLFALLAVLALWRPLRGAPVDADLAAVRGSALWAPLFDDALPVQLVLGDYYIFGERDAQGGVRRLVRDFNINSRRDLEGRFIQDPSLVQRYADLNLGYLPTSSAYALRQLLPVLQAPGRQVTLTLASELDPSSIKHTHIVYVGYLSALGMLEDMVMAESRYTFGSSYDELIDAVSGSTWRSEAGEPHGPTERYRDYAYIAALKGPGGVAHLVIAGTRDTGLMQAADAAASRAQVQALAVRPGPRGFEALYEVQSLNGINVAARLIDASALGP